MPYYCCGKWGKNGGKVRELSFSGMVFAVYGNGATTLNDCYLIF